MIGRQHKGMAGRNNGSFGQEQMNSGAPSPTDPNWPGLCSTCRHAHRIQAARSIFWRCRLSETDTRFARYPRLPVISCIGHEPMQPEPA